VCALQVYKTDSDGNPVLGENGQPQVDYKMSCFKGQCIAASETGRMWQALYQAFKDLLQDLCGLDETTARDMINRWASAQLLRGHCVTKHLPSAVEDSVQDNCHYL
jgi:hypothetical protein